MGFTFFFRDRHTLGQLLDNSLVNSSAGQPVKIWDAGCSNGAEPFTLAIMLAEKLGRDEYTKRVTIYASDRNISTGFDKLIETGIYDKSSLERMPDGILDKYFKPYDEKHYKINDFILDKVKFVYHDLLTYQPFDTNFQIILCKNVLLHFQEFERIKVIDMYSKVLANGGFYCTEQTQPMPKENAHIFEKVVSDANVYKRK